MKPVNTVNAIARLKSQTARYRVSVAHCPGLYINVSPKGGKSYVAVARNPNGNQKWETLGPCDHFSIDEAREKARAGLKRVKAGLDFSGAPTEAADTFGEVAESYMKRKAKAFRTEHEFRRILDSYILPVWKSRPFLSIQRTDVTRLLDTVEDKSGARQADTCLMVVRAIMNWQATRVDDYLPPIIRGMRRDASKPRSRVLSDDEIRLIWPAAANSGIFGAIVRIAILTCQRRQIVRTMKWDDIDSDGVWHIPEAADRAKGNGGNLKLPDMALNIVRAQNRLGGNPHVFPAMRGEGPFNDFSKCKKRLDWQVIDRLFMGGLAKYAKAAKRDPGHEPEGWKPLPGWTIHDLRRTARSLMAKAGVREHIAERVMGHAQSGVEGIYDRYDYADEKADALAKLAGAVDMILNPPEGNVVELNRAKAK